ncbi:MAG: hypothetical protein SNJ57_16025, partial [Cyanobacteriota bacterium]
ECCKNAARVLHELYAIGFVQYSFVQYSYGIFMAIFHCMWSVHRSPHRSLVGIGVLGGFVSVF